MSNQRWWRKGVATCSASSMPVSSSAKDQGVECFYQHGRMAAMAVAPAGSACNREGALMITPVNGTVRPQLLTALDDIDQIIERQPVDDVSSPGGLESVAHVLASSQHGAHGPRQRTPAHEQTEER